MTEDLGSALHKHRGDARVRECCGSWHRLGRKRAAVGYYDHEIVGGRVIRTFVCRRHARRARGLYAVVRNGGFWPDAPAELPVRYPRGTACRWQLVRLPDRVQMGDGRERFVVRWWGGKYAWYGYFTIAPWPGWRFQFKVAHGFRCV